MATRRIIKCIWRILTCLISVSKLAFGN